MMKSNTIPLRVKAAISMSVLLACALPLSVSATAIPLYRGSGTFTSSTVAISPPYPAAMQAGDVCLLVVTSENQAISLSSAQGFAEIAAFSPQSAGTAATNPGIRVALFWKRTVGGDTAPTVADAGNHTDGQIHCFSGVIGSGDPWETGAGGNDGGVNDTAGAIPGATTSTANDLIVLIEGTSNNATATNNCSAWTNADLANITERTDNTNTAGLGGGHCMATGEKATAGSYTTTTVTLSVTTFKGAYSLALVPSTAVAPTVTTDSAQSFTPTSASVFGSVTNTGGETGGSTDTGFAISTNAALSSSVSTTSHGSYSGTGSFNLSTSTLSADTTYYFRAYASNSAGTSYGAIKSFSTGDSTPARMVRLFEGFMIKLISGTLKIFQR